MLSDSEGGHAEGSKAEEEGRDEHARRGADDPGGARHAAKAERPQKSPQKRPVKYLNPSDESETWTGRGHRPRWLKQKLADGHRVEDFLVNGAGGGR
jgi:DNA-binding protein H-NS